MGPGFVPTFLYYFIGTSFIVAFAIFKGVDSSLDINPFQIGIPLGLVAGGMGAYFNSNQTLSLPIKNRGSFLKKLGSLLSEMGYEETSKLDDFTVYERRGLSQVFSGKIFVQIQDKTVTISGRSNRIRRLQKQISE